MSTSTAQKLVLGFAIGGIFLGLYMGKSGAERYRKVWGVTLLSAVGAVLADFIPGLVGPFFALIMFAYATGHMPQIGQVTSSAKSTATGGKTS